MDSNTYKIVAGGLRSVAASFPVAGSFAQAWAELESRRFQERVEEFMKDFSDLVAANQARVQAVERFVTDSPGFAELLDRAIRKTIVESDAEKRHAYALVLFNASTDADRRDLGEKIDALEALDSLNRSDLAVLKRFSDKHPVRVADLTQTQYNFPMATVDGLAKTIGALALSIAKLESRALISETAEPAGVFSWTGDDNHWVNRWRRKAYVMLPFGRTLVEYLSAGVPPDA